MLLNQKVYGLRSFARIWHNSLAAEKLEPSELEQLKRSPCSFHTQKIIATCYVIDLLAFVFKDPEIRCLEPHLGQDFILKNQDCEQVLKLTGIIRIYASSFSTEFGLIATIQHLYVRF